MGGRGGAREWAPVGVASLGLVFAFSALGGAIAGEPAVLWANTGAAIGCVAGAVVLLVMSGREASA